jgi:hypothetical protein
LSSKLCIGGRTELVKHSQDLNIFLICLMMFLLHYNLPYLHIVQATVPQRGTEDKLVVLNFDDTDITQIRYVKPILEKYGFNAPSFQFVGRFIMSMHRKP